MDIDRHNLPEEQGFSVSGQADTYTAGEEVLARARSVSQQIAERVRKLIQAPETETQDAATGEHDSLAE